MMPTESFGGSNAPRFRGVLSYLGGPSSGPVGRAFSALLGLPPRSLTRCGVGEAQWLPPGAWAEYEVEDGGEVVLGIDIGGGRAASVIVP